MITKDRLNELALEVAKNHWHRDSYNNEYFDASGNAHALIKRIEQEAEVVGWICNGELYEVEQRRLSANGGGVFPNQTKLIALPLVEGDTE